MIHDEPRPNPPTPLPPAFYASPRLLSSRGLRDWWTLLHPPYTTWHLCYVVIGACLAPHVDVGRLGATIAAFFLAVGVAAHALDELHGRPLQTAIPSWALVAVSVGGLGGAVALGIAGMTIVGPGLVAFMVVGVVVAVGYNLELWGGRLHTDAVFAFGWGAFPVLTAFYVQAERLAVVAVVGAAFGGVLALAQRRLSTPARLLRRRTAAVTGSIETTDGTTVVLDQAALLAPLEGALRLLTLATILLAGALAVARCTTWVG
jgi:hypothetical protein